MDGKISYSKKNSGIEQSALKFCKLTLGMNRMAAAPHKNDRRTHRDTQWY
jgi:hypothetical protein